MLREEQVTMTCSTHRSASPLEPSEIIASRDKNLECARTGSGTLHLADHTCSTFDFLVRNSSAAATDCSLKYSRLHRRHWSLVIDNFLAEASYL